MNQNIGTIHTLTQPLWLRNPRLGPEGPPRNSVTAIADIVMTFMNSARKKIANRMPVYSVLKPPTSSCSASTRSNGGWFVSAVAAIRKITNGTDGGEPAATGSTNECQFVPRSAGRTMPWVESVPAWMSTPRIARPNAAS